MTPERIEQFKKQRDAVAAALRIQQDTPEEDRPTKPSALKSWLADLARMEALIMQMDSILAKHSPARARPKTSSAAPAPDPDAIVVARIPKGKRAEMRVSVKPWQNRRVVDIRIWAFTADGGGEMKPSRKGIAFDAAKLDVLLNALHQAKQHV